MGTKWLGCKIPPISKVCRGMLRSEGGLTLMSPAEINQLKDIDQSNIDWTGIADTGPCVKCIELEHHKKFIPLEKDWKGNFKTKFAKPPRVQK